MYRGKNIEESICSTFLIMVETTPFYKIKVKSLCEKLGISRNIFYTHFDSIYSVIEKIEDDFFQGFIEERTNAYVHKKGRKLLNGPALGLFLTTSYIDKNKDVLRLLCGNNGDISFQIKLLNNIRFSVKEIINSPDWPKMTNLESELTCEFIANGMLSIIKWRVTQGQNASKEEYAMIVHKLICKCLE